MDAEAPKSEDFIGHLRVRSVRRAPDTYTITANTMIAADVNIARVEGGLLRGWIKQQPVELRVEGAFVKGHVGSAPVELRVSREGTMLVARGLYAGRLAAMRLTLEGRNRCTEGAAEPDELSFGTDGEACTPNLDTVHKMIARLGDTEAAAMLAVARFR